MGACNNCCPSNTSEEYEKNQVTQSNNEFIQMNRNIYIPNR